MRSTYFKRIIWLLIAVLLITNGVSMASFALVGRDRYTELRVENLLSEAELARETFAEYNQGFVSEEGLVHLIRQQSESTGTSLLLTDGIGRTITANAPDGYRAAVELNAYFNEQKQKVLQGETATNASLVLEDGMNAISIGLPVLDGNGNVEAAVFLIKPVDEVTSSFYYLFMVLPLTVVMVVPFILLLAAIWTDKMTRPIYEMADTAIAMSKGDFHVRADASHSGEAGVLAKALNTLCDALSQTILQLESEKSQLNQILQSFTDGVAAIDADGNLTHFNQALQRMFGSVSAETTMDLIPDEEIWRVYRNVLKNHEPQEIRYALPGDRSLVISVVPVLDEKGSCKGVVGLFNDVTEYERLEQTRRDYVANVSHELRSPLTAIRGYLEPLSDGMVQDEATRQHFYQIMSREVIRMSKLITDLLQLSRLQSGTEYMTIEPTDVEELLGETLESFAHEAGKKGISLELCVDNGIPYAMTDRDRIEQILVVLVDNAMRYTGQNGKITLRASYSDVIRVSVEDTGCGIAAAELPHLFERFYKVDKSRHEGGSGLGLSIAKQILDKLGEEISVSSVPGEGTVFTFTLKPYINNAIALGPVSEGGRRQYSQEMPDMVMERDADFEILEPERKKSYLKYPFRNKKK